MLKTLKCMRICIYPKSKSAMLHCKTVIDIIFISISTYVFILPLANNMNNLSAWDRKNRRKKLRVKVYFEADLLSCSTVLKNHLPGIGNRGQCLLHIK